MELPEKIYCGNNGHGNLSYSNLRFPNSVEYIRTDAFIEKACAWFDENLIYYWEQLNVDDTAELLDDFKNYMRGE